VWFAVNDPGEWETFGVDCSNAFGPALDKGVRVFQRRNGPTVDGQVGGDLSTFGGERWTELVC
jgi:hypothetical protein